MSVRSVAGKILSTGKSVTGSVVGTGAGVVVGAGLVTAGTAGSLYKSYINGIDRFCGNLEMFLSHHMQVFESERILAGHHPGPVHKHYPGGGYGFQDANGHDADYGLD